MAENTEKAAAATVKINGHTIRQLNDNNFSDWFVDIRAVLRPQKLWKYAIEPFNDPLLAKEAVFRSKDENQKLKANEAAWLEKVEETADIMTPTIGPKMKSKLKDEHFNNSYLMLLKLKEELEPTGDAQFMRLTKEYYSLNINDFKGMPELLDKVKKLEEQLAATRITLTDDKRTIICLMIALAQDSSYRSLIQIWAAIPNLTAEKAKAMLMEEYRQQEHAEEGGVARKFQSKAAEALNEKIGRKAKEREEQKQKEIEECKTCGKRHPGVCWKEDPSSKPDWVKQKEEWYRNRNRGFNYVKNNKDVNNKGVVKRVRSVSAASSTSTASSSHPLSY